jgi:hypothetical protein
LGEEVAASNVGFEVVKEGHGNSLRPLANEPGSPGFLVLGPPFTAGDDGERFCSRGSPVYRASRLGFSLCSGGG